jgi:hypothetical protein
MTNLTDQQAIQLAMQVLGQRLLASPTPLWQKVNAAMQSIAPISGAPGSCCYLVNNQKVCIDHVTAEECAALGGNFSPQSCAARTDCSP